MLPTGELRCICAAVECYRRRQTTTDAKEQNSIGPYTMCRRASNNHCVSSTCISHLFDVPTYISNNNAYRLERHRITMWLFSGALARLVLDVCTHTHVCSRSRTRRRAYWRAPGDATTFHQFYRACTVCQWSNGSSSNWPLSSSSRCAAKRHRTSRTTASLSLTPDGAVFTRLTPMPSLFRETTLGLKTGAFRWRARKYGTVFPPHCDNQTSNSDSSNVF